VGELGGKQKADQRIKCQTVAHRREKKGVKHMTEKRGKASVILWRGKY